MPEPRRRSVLAQTAVAFSGGAGSYAVAVITGIVVARALGPTGKGIASYATLVMALFTTFGSGLQAAIMYECGRNGRSQLAAYGVAVRLLGLTMLPAAAVLFAVARFNPNEASFAYVACAIPFAVYCQIANGILLLHDDVRATVIQSAIPPFGVALFTIPALTIFGGGLSAVLGIWSAMFALSACYAILRLNRYLPAFSFEGSGLLFREQGWFALKSGAGSLANFLNLRIDVFVVSFLLDGRTLGIYTLAVATGELVWQAGRPLVWSTLGRIAAAEPVRAAALACRVARNVIAVECVLAIGVFWTAPFAIRLVYGDAFAESSTIVRWLLPGIVLYAAQLPLVYFISVKEGDPGFSLMLQTGCALLCAGLSGLLIPHMNVFGAAAATTLTYGCASIVIAARFARSTGIPWTQFTLLQTEDVTRFFRLADGLWPMRRVAAE